MFKERRTEEKGNREHRAQPGIAPRYPKRECGDREESRRAIGLRRKEDEIRAEINAEKKKKGDKPIFPRFPAA